MAASNSFGKLFRLTTFGESHGEVIGGIIDGCPSGLEIDQSFIQHELNRRRPGQSILTTTRKESDEVNFLSGIYNGLSTGTPIGFLIYNRNKKPKDYEHLTDVYRPSHADFTYDKKYNLREANGGGRSSARETANWVVGGAIAKLILKKYNIIIQAFVDQIGEISLKEKCDKLDFDLIEASPVRCPNIETSDVMTEYLKKIRKEGDSVGGKIKCLIQNVPIGLGEPVFDKLHANLAKAMMSINAVKGFEYGSGFSSVAMKGSEHNDLFEIQDEKIRTKTNYSGGIQGGISNGENIYFGVAFKPIPTILKDQESVNHKNEKIIVKGKGRHDICPVPRAVPIVEAMAAIVIVNHLFLNRSATL